MHYMVILEDRHTDVHVEVYSTLEKALARANEIVECYDIEGIEQYAVDCWKFNRNLSDEGDAIRVEEVEIDVAYDL